METGENTENKQVKIKYPYVGHKVDGHLLSKVFIPTKIASFLFFSLFLLSVMLSVFTMSMDFTSISDEPNATIMQVGYPYPMLIITSESSALFPFNIKNILLDVSIFLAISYIINILMNLFSLMHIGGDKTPDTIKEIKIKKTLAEKVGEKAAKVVEENTKQINQAQI